MKPRTERERLVAFMQHDLGRLQFSIGAAWPHWPHEDIVKMMELTTTLEKIVKHESPAIAAHPPVAAHPADEDLERQLERSDAYAHHAAAAPQPVIRSAEQERAAFEAWWNDGADVPEHYDDEPFKSLAFDAWQAARAVPPASVEAAIQALLDAGWQLSEKPWLEDCESGFDGRAHRSVSLPRDALALLGQSR